MKLPSRFEQDWMSTVVVAEDDKCMVHTDSEMHADRSETTCTGALALACLLHG